MSGTNTGLGRGPTWTRSLAPTGAVAVSGRLGDGAGQGAPARLGWELGELLHVICKLDLLRGAKEEKSSVSRCSLWHILLPGYMDLWVPLIHPPCWSHGNEHPQCIKEHIRGSRRHN